jgi:hypothetical protein
VAQEINVKLGAVSIADGETTPQDFGAVVEAGTNPSLTFTVENTGDATLTISSVTLPTGYAFGSGNEVPAGGTTINAVSDKDLIVELDSSLATGVKSGDISIVNDDPTGGESPYNFAISGGVVLAAYSLAAVRSAYVSLAGTGEVTVNLDPRYQYKLVHTGADGAGLDNDNAAKSGWLSTLSATITADSSVEDEKFELTDGDSETFGSGISKLYLVSTADGDAVIKIVRIGTPTTSY